jgi:hypothetical protein
MHKPSLNMAKTASVLSLGLAMAGMICGQCTYQSSSGTSTLTTTYNPNSPAAKAPFPGVTPAAPPPNTFMPSVPLAQYLAWKTAASQNQPSTFPSPPGIKTIPAPNAPLAPAPTPPTVQTPTYSWQSIQQIVNYTQPSPDIAVGPTDVIMAINGDPGTTALGAIALFTRQGTLIKQVAFETWFAPILSTLCPDGLSSCQIFDPVLRYDQLHGRFLFLASSRDTRTSLFGFTLLSVSNGATFNSGWKIWALNPATDNTGATWGDYWRLSYDTNAVYLTGNLFSPLSFQYAKIRVVRKSDLYNSAATTLPFTDYWNLQEPGDGKPAFALAPAQQRGPNVSSNTALFVNAAFDSGTPANFLTVWKLTSPLGPASLSCSTISGLPAYTGPAIAKQLGGGGQLDTGDNRVLKAILRGGFVYIARGTGYGVCPGGNMCTSVTYDVIDTSTMSLHSQSRLHDGYFFYPAFDIPATTPPGQPFATNNPFVTGTTTAADGTLTYAGISNMKTGEDYYQAGFPSDIPWGNYFGGAVDPVYGGLWVSGYAKPQSGGQGVYGTWAGYFPWLTAAAFTDVNPTSPFADYINILSLWQIASGCSLSPPSFCPGDIVPRNQLAALIVRAMFGTTFSYSTVPYFTDVSAADPYFPFIQKLRDLGIAAGCSANRYCPSDPMTRATAASLIIRGKLTSLSGDNFSFPTTPYFDDVPANSGDFPFVQKMSELGMTSGCTVSSYCPNRLLTRQEAAVFVVRAFIN